MRPIFLSLLALPLALTISPATDALGAQVRPVQRQPPVSKPPAAPPTATPAPATPTLAIPLARVRGDVYDSVALAPLAQATIQFVDAQDPSKVRSVRTDSLGSFVIDSVRVGMYFVGMIHPQLDRLGLDTRIVQVNVANSGDVTLPLGVPSPATILATACGNAGSGMAEGAWVGLVRTARGTPLEATARVRAQFRETVLAGNGLQRRFPTRFADASAAGAFAVCGLPPEAQITSRAYAGKDSSGVVEFKIPSHGLLVRDIYIANPERVAAEGAAGRNITQLRGSGRVRGVVRDSLGRPLSGARVSLPGAAGTAASNANGQFSLDSLPGGSWMIEARAVGFEPMRVPVDIIDDIEASAEVAMASLTPTVDTVKVRADRWAQQMAGFEERRKMGGGYYMDDAALARRNAQYTADIFRATPGVQVQPGNLGSDRVMMRGNAGTGTCVPSVFLNGLLTPAPNGVLDNLVNPGDIRAVEIYPRTGSVPIQFQDRNGCGSIVVWTGAKRPPSDR
ncbi:MAG: TonB-dependent receptor [Gemmatimonadaceae bacterium]|nr:TonB-dependent receptor [Gemmatimonadaceae bacterium]